MSRFVETTRSNQQIRVAKEASGDSFLQRLIYCLFTIALFCSRPALAQVRLERVYPPLVSVLNTEPQWLQAEGKFPTWPVEIHCDRSDVQVSCGEKKGELKVQMSKDAPQGIAWLRLTDAKSASDLVPLLLECAEVASETEPNERPSESQAVASNASVGGRLAKSEDVDGFEVSLKAEVPFVVSLIGNQILKSPMDAVLQICDSKGNVLAQNDDQRGIDPQIVFMPKKDGDYLVRLFAFPQTPNSTIGFSGAKNYCYVLRLNTNGFSDHFLPIFDPGLDNRSAIYVVDAHSEDVRRARQVKLQAATKVNPQIAYTSGRIGWQWLAPLSAGREYIANSATWRLQSDRQSMDQPPVIPPAIFSGTIYGSKEEDLFTVQLEAEKSYRIAARSREFGFVLDSRIDILHLETKEVLAKGKDLSRNNYDQSLTFKAKQTGSVSLRIRDAVRSGSYRHSYSVLVEKVAPQLKLNLAAQRYAVSKGKSLEIPVGIARSNGFSESIEVSVRGLPSGVIAKPVESQGKGDSSKLVKLKLEAAVDCEDFQGWIEVVGTLNGPGENAPETYSASFPLRPSVPLKRCWLTVHAP